MVIRCRPGGNLSKKPRQSPQHQTMLAKEGAGLSNIHVGSFSMSPEDVTLHDKAFL